MRKIFIRGDLGPDLGVLESPVRVDYSGGVRGLRTAGQIGALVGLLVAWLGVGVGQDVVPDLRYLSHQAWSTEQGLPQNSVHAILQTRDGYLWVATEGGLARFDGVGFRVFGRGNEAAFSSDDVCCLKEDGDGLWIGTADGVVREAGGRFERAPAKVFAGSESGEVGGWSWTAAGVELKPKEERKGREGSAEGAKEEHGGRGGHGGKATEGAEEEHGGRGGQGGKAKEGAAAGGDGEWRVGRELPGRVQTVLVDRAGLAWVGMKNGLVVLRAGHPAAEPVAALQGNSVLSVFEDAEGNHWVGTETSGLHVLRRLKFRGEPGVGGLAVTSVVQAADGAMWVGTRDDGLRRLRGGKVAEPVAAGKLTSGVILCLAPDDTGGVWAGTPDGLNHVGAQGSVRRITSAEGLEDDYVRAIAVAPDGVVWVGTSHGLARWKDGRVKTLTSADGLGGDAIGALLLAGGRSPDVSASLWVGTSNGASEGAEAGERGFQRLGGLEGQIVSSLAMVRRWDLWAATQGGELALLPGHGGFEKVEGLPSGGKITGMTGDGSGALWLRMERGVWRVSADSLAACVRAHCAAGEMSVARYGLAEGMSSEEVVAGETSGGWLARDGEMWFPTRRGVAVVDTAHLAVDEVAPPVVVERFSVDDVAVIGGEEDGFARSPLSVARSPLRQETDQGIAIPYGRERMTVEYAGLSFTAPGEVRYRFRLEGFDKEWTEAGTRRTATYTNLPPGPYRFVVQARNGDGIWNRTGAEVRFRIVPPYWRRWWFIGLMVVLLLAILAGLYYLRVRRLRREFGAVLAERNRMAREIHDTLTQDFVGTSLQLDMVTQMLKKGRVEQALEQVARTRRLVTEGLDEARQSIWELRANRSQDSLPTRLTRLVQRESFAGIAPKLHVGGAYRALEPRVEREVLRVAQEALSNVQRHARATETTVNLHYSGIDRSDEALLLTIADNGVGFAASDSAQKAGHYGLVGMKERAAVVDGALEIVSELGKGTVVTLRLPIGS